MVDEENQSRPKSVSNAERSHSHRGFSPVTNKHYSTETVSNGFLKEGDEKTVGNGSRIFSRAGTHRSEAAVLMKSLRVTTTSVNRYGTLNQ